MTDTLTPITTKGITTAEATTEVQTEAQTAALAPVAGGCHEVVDVDPATLVIGDNVRAAAHLDRPFLASLREFGVMTPIQAVRSEEGTLTVKRGQRRTMGAIKAGLLTVPVLIVSDDASEADRIVKQWHENERRDALSTTDRLAVVEQLTILGVPAGTVARRLGTPKKQIEAAVLTSGSEKAKAAAAKHALSFTEAALIAEFEDDDATVADLLAAIRDGENPEHVAQRARDEKARQQLVDATVATLVEAGVTVIDRPGYDNKVIKDLREIRMVKKDGDPKATSPTEKEHASCPGHAAYVTAYYRSDPQVTYMCTDPKGNGHALCSWSGQTIAPSQQPGGGMTDEQKAERKSLIANNKAWDSAERVRRAWISESFLTRTTTPKGAETFLALAVAHGEHVEDGYRLHAELTAKAGETTPGEDWERRYNAQSAVTARADAATPKQAVMLALALLVCEWEAGTSRNTWRRPSDRDRRHLTALIAWGYQPSDVERLILAQPEQVTGPVQDDAAEATPEPVEDDATPEPVTEDEDDEPVERVHPVDAIEDVEDDATAEPVEGDATLEPVEGDVGGV